MIAVVFLGVQVWTCFSPSLLMKTMLKQARSGAEETPKLSTEILKRTYQNPALWVWLENIFAVDLLRLNTLPYKTRRASLSLLCGSSLRGRGGGGGARCETRTTRFRFCCQRFKLWRIFLAYLTELTENAGISWDDRDLYKFLYSGPLSRTAEKWKFQCVYKLLEEICIANSRVTCNRLLGKFLKDSPSNLPDISQTFCKCF